MPGRKKKKNRNGADLSSAAVDRNVSAAAFEMGYTPWESRAPFPGDAGAGRKHTAEPDSITMDEIDEELILTYLAYYRLLEQSLVRAGFVMASGSHKQARPDWYRWARHIEKQFDPLSSEELGMAVDHLLQLRDDMESLPGRMQNRLTWESASRFSDNLWLAEMLQRTGSLLVHRYNFAEVSGSDTPRVMAALFVVEAWLQLVPGG